LSYEKFLVLLFASPYMAKSVRPPISLLFIHVLHDPPMQDSSFYDSLCVLYDGRYIVSNKDTLGPSPPWHGLRDNVMASVALVSPASFDHD
jgi:hypothetical protein